MAVNQLKMFLPIMRYPVIIIIALVLCSFVSPKEESGFSVKEYESCYFVDTVANTYDYHFIDIKNETAENIWILIEKDTTVTNIEMINQRFKRRPPTGGMSYYEWIFDGNVIWATPTLELYSRFFKILPPGETFTIAKKQKSHTEETDFIKYVRVITSAEMRTLFKVLVQLTPDTEPSYQPNVLVVE